MTSRKVACRTRSVNEGLSRELGEERAFLFGEFLRSIGVSLDQLRHELQKRLGALLESGIVLYGYSGGLKACTLLNWLSLDHDSIIMVVDKDPNKQGKVIPMTSIPIDKLEELPSTTPVTVVILALDHKNEVKRFLRSYLAPGSRIIDLLPRFRATRVRGHA